MRMKENLVLARRLTFAIVGRDVGHRAEISVPSEVHGSAYGSWVVSTLALAAESIVYSFGIGEDVSFDVSLISKYGLTVHGFDPTPKSVVWTRSQDLPASFQFHEIGIADRDGRATFYAPRNPAFASYTTASREGDARYAVEANVLRLETIMRRLDHEHIDVLKLDVEGSEYGVLSDVMASNLDVRQILVEFHHRFENIGVRKTNDAVDLLRKNGYRLFYVSPRGEDYCFVRSDVLPSRT